MTALDSTARPRILVAIDIAKVKHEVLVELPTGKRRKMVPSRAVDGNTDGVYANNSVTHTSSELNAWWHVDLGQVETLGTIKVWNRVEFPERLTNFVERDISGRSSAQNLHFRKRQEICSGQLHAYVTTSAVDCQFCRKAALARSVVTGNSSLLIGVIDG